MAATQRRARLASAAAAAGMLVLGRSANAGAGTAQPPPPAAPHGQLLQAADGTLYLLVAGQAHPITPAPLADETLTTMTAGEALPDGAFWLTPVAAPPELPPVPPLPAARNTAPFFATQTAIAPRGATGSQRSAAAATARPVTQRAATTPAAPRVAPTPGSWTLGQS
jgi:hypothetical protein